MTPVFLDTSYLLALLLATDESHQTALDWQNRVTDRPLLTSEFVLLELADALARPQHRQQATNAILLLRNAARVTIAPASTDLLDHGLAYYENRPDKAWGLTDCTSFLLMENHGATEALTTDHHFEQAGFVALLRQPSRK